MSERYKEWSDGNEDGNNDSKMAWQAQSPCVTYVIQFHYKFRSPRPVISQVAPPSPGNRTDACEKLQTRRVMISMPKPGPVSCVASFHEPTVYVDCDNHCLKQVAAPYI